MFGQFIPLMLNRDLCTALCMFKSSDDLLYFTISEIRGLSELYQCQFSSQKKST